MKLVSFAASGRNSYGAVVGDGVFDLGRRPGDRYPTLRAAIAGDALGAAAAEVKSGAPDIARSQVTLLPPITDPDKIICAGRNYRAHAAEAGGAPPENPSVSLAAAMKNATATLQRGLRASEAQGTPISAKFEIEGGKLQLKIYTMKGDDFMEVVADPKTGAIAKAEEITDAMDLNEAIEQKTAVEKATVPLHTAAEAAVKANAGARAVSIVPELKNGQATAEVILLARNTFKKVTEKLD